MKSAFKTGSRIEGGHYYGGVVFSGIGVVDTEIRGASFGDDVKFLGCNLSSVKISSCYLGKSLSFDEDCKLEKDVEVSDIQRVEGDLSIVSTSLGDRFAISNVECGSLYIRHVTSAEHPVLYNVESRGSVYILDSTFGEEARFEQVCGNDIVSLGGCIFRDRPIVELQSVADHVAISGVTVGKMADVSVASTRVAIEKSDFEGGGSISVRGEDVSIYRLKSSDPLTLSRSANAPTSAPANAKLKSLRDLDVQNVTLDGLDLSECSLGEVRNMEKMRIESTVVFAARTSRMMTRRRLLADEAAWRKGRSHFWPGWRWLPFRRPRGEEANTTLTLERQYRMLRKGLEDGGDQPGASDFYYGEMEMRRASASGWERLLLKVYWAVSGYGLRSSRSIIALTAVLLLASLALWRYGFLPPQTTAYDVMHQGSTTSVIPRQIQGPQPDLASSIAFTVRTATSLTRPGNLPPLTAWGEVLEIAVRVIGPILVALAALAVRARVKR
ncbi:hypothetical protein [Actinomycetospora chiangmaiensis]|uniref:hypothetical protein n=1 Tax=Actinomycetospora chiangmaiensis TaxID=402650 RepID=UPI0012F8832C|nr:hypothetical protein [Actinomycetospora chiangmaiensis]